MHCLNLSDSKFVITDGDDANLEAIFESRDEIKNAGMRILVDDKTCQLPNSDFERLPELVETKSYDKVSPDWGRRQIKHKDPGEFVRKNNDIFKNSFEFNKFFKVCLIFTSGTTGLPKAAPISHQKSMKTYNCKIALKMKPGDVTYSIEFEKQILTRTL